MENKFLQCSECNAKLVNYIVVPANKITTIKANCPFCQSESYLTKVSGTVQSAGVSPEISHKPTQILDIEIEKNLIIFTIGKI